ncbi:hypothetical protein [Azospirillum sp. ST 5-10]|uniref:hypothetical protein n=1 Tax=Azospirillum sp. ST 5-10 TaxID=3445776 RepID=UPI003F4A4BDD
MKPEAGQNETQSIFLPEGGETANVFYPLWAISGRCVWQSRPGIDLADPVVLFRVRHPIAATHRVDAP